MLTYADVCYVSSGDAWQGQSLHLVRTGSALSFTTSFTTSFATSFTLLLAFFLPLHLVRAGSALALLLVSLLALLLVSLLALLLVSLLALLYC